MFALRALLGFAVIGADARHYACGGHWAYVRYWSGRDPTLRGDSDIIRFHSRKFVAKKIRIPKSAFRTRLIPWDENSYTPPANTPG